MFSGIEERTLVLQNAALRESGTLRSRNREVYAGILEVNAMTQKALTVFAVNRQNEIVSRLSSLVSRLSSLVSFPSSL
ncbi:hypothetical protein THOD04_120108 [Vibrio owensii]|nr:hypothetical protein THOD04_120108 [Vibrio owensii]